MDPKVEIEHNKPSKTYFPSEQVNGIVIIIGRGSNETDCTVLTEVTIRLEGRRVAVKKGSKLEEFYFHEKQSTLLNTETVLAPDEVLDLPFEFQLPPKLPSSFQVNRGFVEYSLVVLLRRRHDFDLNSRSQFFINGVLLLNPAEQLPVELHQSKAVGFCSCFNFRKARRFGLTLKLAKDQYLPGGSIDYSIKIWNSSKSTLKNLTIALVRELKILDSGDFHVALKEREIICSILGPQVQPSEKLTWTSYPQTEENLSVIIKPPITIPEDTPPTHLGCVRVIQLNYFVQIYAKATDLYSSTLSCKCPILIGTHFPG